MLKSPVLNASATERPVIIRGVDWNSIFPIWKSMFSLDPAENGPEMTVIAPENASDTEMSSENRDIRRHLLDMGLTRGVEVKVKKIAPVGDPIDIELRDYELCISKSDLSQIEVEVIK